MRVGGHYSDFKRAQLKLEIVEAPLSNYSTQGGGAKVPYSYCIASEI